MVHGRAGLSVGLFALMASYGCSSSSAPTSNTGAAGATSASSLTGPSGTVACGSEAGVDTYAAGLQKLGANGELTFTLVSSTPAPPALNDNTFVLQVSGPGGVPLAGELNAVLDMPEHGHTSPKTPVITFDATSGSFQLDPMYLFMVGLWRFTFTFTPALANAGGAAGATDAPVSADSAVFQFCVD